MGWDKGLWVRIDLNGELGLILWLGNKSILPISIDIDGHSNNFVGGDSGGEYFAILEEVVLDRKGVT